MLNRSTNLSRSISFGHKYSHSGRRQSSIIKSILAKVKMAIIASLLAMSAMSVTASPITVNTLRYDGVKLTHPPIYQDQNQSCAFIEHQYPQPPRSGSTTLTANLPHLPYANPQAPKGGELSLSVIGSFNSANAWMNTGHPMAGTEYLYDTLLTSALDGSFMIYPQLASAITYDPKSPDWVIYHLNPRARFWDGSPVTSRDVKASFTAILSDKGLVHIRSYLADIEGITILDDTSIRFDFKSPSQQMLFMVGQFPVFAKSSLDASFGQISLTPLMGSGAYQLKAVNEGRRVIYQRNPNYWGRDLMVNRGRFNFDLIKMVYYRDEDIAFEGFKSGQFQFFYDDKISRWMTGYYFPAVKRGLITQEDIINKNPVTMKALVMNLRKPLFADIRVRQALTLAFDFELLNRTLFYGKYERLDSFFYGSELAATGVPSQSEMQVLSPLLPLLNDVQKQAVLNEWRLTPSYDTTEDDVIQDNDIQNDAHDKTSHISNNNNDKSTENKNHHATNGKNNNKNHHHQNRHTHRDALLRARRLLLDAGFYYQDMQLHQPDGSPARIEVLITDEHLSRELMPYIRNLKRLGFDAGIRLVDNPQYQQRLRHFDYDMMVASIMQGLTPGAEQAYLWGSAAAMEAGSRNYSGIQSPAIDKVIARFNNAQSRDEVVTNARVLDRLLRAGHYMIPLYGKRSDSIAYWDKYRHVDDLPDHAIGLDYWWVDKEAEGKMNTYLGQ